MKTTLNKILLVLAFAAGTFATTGCQTATKKIAELNEVLIEAERLGLDEVTIPGRVTVTRFKREEKDGRIFWRLTHNNPGLSEPLVIVRSRPATAAKE